MIETSLIALLPTRPERYKVLVAVLLVLVGANPLKTPAELNVNRAVVAVPLSSNRVILLPDAPLMLFQLLPGTIPGLWVGAKIFTPPEKLTPILAAWLWGTAETIIPKTEPATNREFLMQV